MRQHLKLLIAPCLASLLSGCTLLTESPEPEPRLGPEVFADRIDRLESNIAERCDRQEHKLDAFVRQQVQLGAELRDVGRLLHRHTRDTASSDISGTTPLVIQQRCEQEDSLLANKVLVGRSEWVGLPDVGTYLKARVDSGANTSSLSATEITPFERDGEDWVRFKLGVNENDVVVEDVVDEWIEEPVERRVRIIQAAGEESRPVISLLMTLGSIREPVEFTLNDRSHLSYPVLLGRRFLLDISIIDVAQAYIHDRPEFPGGLPSEESDVDEVDDPDDEEEA
ncbi:ATP-dependent zinc protease [Halomonas sp. TRM85114]|uniref:ATP-dependent zinc protease family protein n=1 Tax=Halomonas jincaotanensis TaxID=2810616 RepID=UPI001BD47525|nr:ATP-dependent zinc protease [Halomonas jincaotanensis]MBS9402572.1 ATP-dependent zinc protease [Halomonas jincaotanensis]